MESGGEGGRRRAEERTLDDSKLLVPGMTAGGQARATERLAFPKTPEPLRATFLESCSVTSNLHPSPSSASRSLRYLSTPTPVAMYPSRVLRMQPSRAFYSPAPVSDAYRPPRSYRSYDPFRLMLTCVCRRRLTAVRPSPPLHDLS